MPVLHARQHVNERAQHSPIFTGTPDRLDNPDNLGNVTPRRYPKGNLPCLKLIKPLKTLVFIQLVPVVGLEPTRLFIVPGF